MHKESVGILSGLNRQKTSTGSLLRLEVPFVTNLGFGLVAGPFLKPFLKCLKMNREKQKRKVKNKKINRLL